MHVDVSSFGGTAGFYAGISSSGMKDVDLDKFDEQVLRNSLPLPVDVPNASPARYSGTRMCLVLY